jgi:hypothetical protein
MNGYMNRASCTVESAGLANMSRHHSIPISQNIAFTSRKLLNIRPGRTEKGEGRKGRGGKVWEGAREEGGLWWDTSTIDSRYDKLHPTT